MRAFENRTVRLLLLMWILGSLTVVLQAYVGHSTIYSTELQDRREELHRAILLNDAPGGGRWDAAGAKSMHLRIGAVYLAEAIHELTHLELGTVYLLIDTVFLFAAVLALFFYLRKWLPDTYCVIGVLYFCSVLPLTYFLHYFHPYDRIQLAIWILLLYLTRERRTILLGASLAISVAIKFDTLVLPIFYFLAYARPENWRRVGVETVGLFVIAFSVYMALVSAFPAPLDQARLNIAMMAYIVKQNIADMLAKNIAFPPLLGYAAPLVLSLVHLATRDRFLRASVWFACTLAIVFFVFSLYQEIRAQLVILVLIMPAALLTVRSILEPNTQRDACREHESDASLPAPEKARC